MCRRSYNGISQSDFFQILWKLWDILHFILSWHPLKIIEIHSAIASEPRCSVTFCGEEYCAPCTENTITSLIFDSCSARFLTVWNTYSFHVPHPLPFRFAVLYETLPVQRLSSWIMDWKKLRKWRMFLCDQTWCMKGHNFSTPNCECRVGMLRLFGCESFKCVNEIIWL